MSSIVESLLETSKADTDVLLVNQSQGDVLSLSRNVQFSFVAPDQQKAELVASFIDDNRYGNAIPRSDETGHFVFVTIEMPITQNILCSISALMACISQIFGIDYDGWESDLQRSE